MTEALVVQNMVKKYPSFCLDINHLAFPRGSILGLVGPNGAGKSTLMKLMLNLVHPDKGDIWILGRHFRRQELEIKSLVGYVPEECRVYEEVTPAWAGQFISGFYSSWDHRFYTKLLEKFRLPGNTKVKELSKGSKMKLSLCLALAHRPELLLLDEPTSGLDPVARHKLLQELLEVVQDETRSVFLSTHTVSDIEKIADYMAFLRGGRLVYCDDKESILQRWRRIHFKLGSQSGKEILPELFIHTEGDGNNFIGVVDNFGAQTMHRLKRMGLEPLEQVPLPLEEIMITFPKGRLNNVETGFMWWRSQKIRSKLDFSLAGEE